MKAKWICSLSVLVIVLIAGCATRGRNLVHDGVIEIEKVSSRKVTITSVQVFQEDSQVEVRGIGEALVIPAFVRMSDWNQYIINE